MTDIKNQLLSKQKKISFSEGMPGAKFGKDGDMTVRYIKGQGLFLFIKMKSKWYASRFTLYSPKNQEREESVYLPLKKFPKSAGELTTKDNKTYVGTGGSKRKQVVGANASKVLDITEVLTERATQKLADGSTAMDDTNGGVPDFLIQNTGHAHLHIHSKAIATGDAFDSYISFSRLHPETFNLIRWVMGYDASTGDFVWNYRSATNSGADKRYQPDTPSATSYMEMKLSSEGNLETAGTIKAGSISEVGSDTDKFLTSDSGVVKYVTGANLASYIGALTSAPVTALNNATENELVTVGATTTELDAESGLTFNDGLNITKTSGLTNHIKMMYDGSNFCVINVTSTGHTTFQNAGGGADMLFDSNGDIILDSADGNFIAKKSNVEFSAANSAYAGMILGYTRIQNLDDDAGDNTITIGNTFAVIETVAGTKANVSFVAPPSGNVEIVFSALCYAVSKSFYFSLSDNATYNELNEIHTYDGFGHRPDESDYSYVTFRWTVTGLTAGTSYQYWIGAKCSSASGYIYHGESERFGVHTAPIIVKAVALPATIVTGQ